jgi:hypothetical protein
MDFSIDASFELSGQNLNAGSSQSCLRKAGGCFPRSPTRESTQERQGKSHCLSFHLSSFLSFSIGSSWAVQNL